MLNVDWLHMFSCLFHGIIFGTPKCALLVWLNAGMVMCVLYEHLRLRTGEPPRASGTGWKDEHWLIDVCFYGNQQKFTLHNNTNMSVNPFERFVTFLCYCIWKMENKIKYSVASFSWLAWFWSSTTTRNLHDSELELSYCTGYDWPKLSQSFFLLFSMTAFDSVETLISIESFFLRKFKFLTLYLKIFSKNVWFWNIKTFVLITYILKKKIV